MSTIANLFPEHDLKFDKSYFSALQNMEPAMGDTALQLTSKAIVNAYGPRLRRAPGMRDVTQLDFKDGSKLFSHSKEWIDFQMDCKRQLDGLTLAEITPHAAQNSALIRGFETLATHGGLPMNPTITPRLDKIGKPIGTLTADYMKVLKLTTEVYTESWEASSLHINGKSNSGLFSNTNDKLTKINFWNERVMPLGKSFIDGLISYNEAFFLRHFGFMPVTLTTIRIQVEKASKVRSGYNYLGKKIDSADKAIDQSLSFGHVMNAGRQRVAYALDTMVNIPVQAVFAGFRKVALAKYAKTWHTRFPTDTTDAINKYGNWRAYDASNFDTTYSREEIVHITESLLNVTDRFKQYVLAMCHLPLVIKSDVRDESGAYLVNNRTYPAGHQSGVAHVSDYNKIRGTDQSLYALAKLGRFDLNETNAAREYIRKFLKHEDDDFACLNQGDDTILLCTNAAQLDKWSSILEGLEFTVWERDYLPKFLGDVWYERFPGARLETTLDPTSGLEKIFANERSVHSHHRTMSSSGALDRINSIKAAPGGSDVINILNSTAMKHFSRMNKQQNFEDILRDTIPKDFELLSQKLEQSIDADVLSRYDAATREFILNPDVIHYKYTPDEIHPDVLSGEFGRVSEDAVINIIETMELM
jgi:hypothetical protein